MLQRTIAVYVHTTDVGNLNKNRESDLSQATELIQGKLHVSLNDSPSPEACGFQSDAASQAEGTLRNMLAACRLASPGRCSPRRNLNSETIRIGFQCGHDTAVYKSVRGPQNVTVLQNVYFSSEDWGSQTWSSLVSGPLAIYTDKKKLRSFFSSFTEIFF